MATANLTTVEPRNNGAHLRVVTGQREAFHRIQQVREEQGVSVRTASRRLGVDARTVRAEEDCETDLPLSRLFAWQEILDVPLVDLLEEPTAPLSRPVLERAKLVRIMKTAMSMRDASKDSPLRRLATMIVEQLVELMPELEEVSSWHTVGQRRSLDELGRVAERPISCRNLIANGLDD
jgi:transcriptional regulator with XRE-family HTH domain